MSDKQKVDKAEKDSWRVKSLEEIREERKKKQGLLDVTTDTEPVIPMDSVIVLESASSDHEEDGDEGQQRASSGEERYYYRVACSFCLSTFYINANIAELLYLCILNCNIIIDFEMFLVYWPLVIYVTFYYSI